MDDKDAQKQIKEIAEKVYDENAIASQYQVTRVPYHTHNGTDSQQINAKDIIHNNKIHTGLVFEAEGTGGITTARITIRGLSNISRIDLIAIAANNVGGGSATQKAMINGTAEFGRCYLYSNPDPVTAPVLLTTTNGIPFIQTCNYSYFDEAAFTNVQVGTLPNYLAYAAGPGVGQVVAVRIVEYTNDSIILEGEILEGAMSEAVGWKLSANLIIT